MDLETNAFLELTVLGGMRVKLHALSNEMRSRSRKDPAGSASKLISFSLGGHLSVNSPEASVLHHPTLVFQGRKACREPAISLKGSDINFKSTFLRAAYLYVNNHTENFKFLFSSWQPHQLESKLAEEQSLFPLCIATSQGLVQRQWDPDICQALNIWTFLNICCLSGTQACTGDTDCMSQGCSWALKSQEPQHDCNLLSEDSE